MEHTQSNSQRPLLPPAQHPRPRRRFRDHVGKLPKMTNSERGKYYRRKYKEYEESLEQTVLELRNQVHTLEMLGEIREELAYRNSEEASESMVWNVFEYFTRARHGINFSTSFYSSAVVRTEPPRAGASVERNDGYEPVSPEMQQWNGNSPFHTILFYDLLSFRVEGGYEAPVIVVEGVLHTEYSRSTIETLFPHAIDHLDVLAQLIDKEIKYRSTFYFFFTVDGVLRDRIIDTDLVYGLQQVLGRLEIVTWLLSGTAYHVRNRQDSFEAVVQGQPSSPAVDLVQL